MGGARLGPNQPVVFQRARMAVKLLMRSQGLQVPTRFVVDQQHRFANLKRTVATLVGDAVMWRAMGDGCAHDARFEINSTG